ncbi:hypothetical protein H0H93_008947 [Arthromyces matolae]|nr:hypothetical protein H0H93_008947 [Arthromyces matolae]
MPLDPTSEGLVFHRKPVNSNEISSASDNAAIVESELAIPTSRPSTRVSSPNPSAIERIQRPSATLETLPPELLDIILQHVVSKPNNRLIYPPQGDLHVHCHQWPLRHVCRAWRAFALAEPNFWNNIHIFLDRISKEEKPYHESRLEFWNHHIVDSLCPLTVTIIGDETEDMDPQVTIIQDMILRPNNYRIFELTSKPWNVLITFLKPKLVFPVLERFHCVVPRLANIQILETMPSLRELYITPVYDRLFNHLMIGYMPLPRKSIPWAQLTYLSVSDETRESQWDSIDLMMSLHILLLCTKLKRCTFHIAPSTEEFFMVQHVYPPDLESLCIFQTFDERATTANVFLNYIIAPSLVNLEYSSVGAYCIGPTEVLSFLHRSNCSLKSLYLDSEIWCDNPGPDADTVQLLQMVPSATVFYAPILHLSESVVEEIVTGVLLPNVEALGFSATINLPALMGLLHQNGIWRPPHDSVVHPKLRNVSIYSDSNVPSNDQKTGRLRFTFASRGSLHERITHFKSSHAF